MLILHKHLHLKMWSPKGLSCTPQAYSGSLSICLRQLVNSQLSNLFSEMLRHRAISGYPVWGESMLGSRWKCSLAFDFVVECAPKVVRAVMFDAASCAVW